MSIFSRRLNFFSLIGSSVAEKLETLREEVPLLAISVCGDWMLTQFITFRDFRVSRYIRTIPIVRIIQTMNHPMQIAFATFGIESINISASIPVPPATHILIIKNHIMAHRRGYFPERTIPRIKTMLTMSDNAIGYNLEK